MVRPCFLVIDKQYPGSISARKLVIETALLNVITAYGAEEAIQTLARYPNVDGIVLDTEVQGMTCRQLIERLRSIRTHIPIVTVSPTGYEPCGGEQHHVVLRSAAAARANPPGLRKGSQHGRRRAGSSRRLPPAKLIPDSCCFLAGSQLVFSWPSARFSIR